jgi:hypothetical protein
VPESPVVYDDVEVLDDDALGFVCRIGNERVFVGKYVPIDGTNLRRKGDRGRLALPRWFVEQQGLPLDRHLSDVEVDEWFALARVRIAAARERVARAPTMPTRRPLSNARKRNWRRRSSCARGVTAAERRMAKTDTDEAAVQLATRLPASLLQRVKLCALSAT